MRQGPRSSLASSTRSSPTPAREGRDVAGDPCRPSSSRIARRRGGQPTQGTAPWQGAESRNGLEWRKVSPVPPSEQLVSLEEVSSGWRAALDVAENALRAASFDLSPEEVRDRRRRLTEERARIARLLDGLAGEKGLDDPFLSLMIPRSELKRVLGLAPGVEACVFDLEGVLIASAAVHAAAWAETFDEFIWARIERTGGRFALAPFDPRADYPQHIHGKSRLEGVRAFLASRGISLPEGSPDDTPGTETVHGLANRKNRALLRRLDEQGVTAYEGTRRYLEVAHEVGVRCAVVSASANTQVILERAGLEPLIESYVDGNVIVAEKLRPEPAPDMLLAACRQLGVEPRHAAAFETSRAGIEAARTCGFDLVVGIGPTAQADLLLAHGADLGVAGLTGLVDRNGSASRAGLGRKDRHDAHVRAA